MPKRYYKRRVGKFAYAASWLFVYDSISLYKYAFKIFFRQIFCIFVFYNCWMFYGHIFFLLFPRKYNRKGCSASRRVGQQKFAAVQADDFSGNTKTESKMIFGLMSIIHTVKALKDSAFLCIGNARAVVRDTQLKASRLGAQT